MTDKRGAVPDSAVGPELLEKWALAHLERFASSAENLRRVLLRRVRRRQGLDADPAAVSEARQAIEALVARYRAAGLLDDAAYAAGRARTRINRGQSLRTIRAGLAGKGVAAADAAAAIDTLRQGMPDPELAAAAAFARRRRLGPFRQEAGDPQQRGRDLAAFGRAGFDRRTADTILACGGPDEVAALLDPDREPDNGG